MGKVFLRKGYLSSGLKNELGVNCEGGNIPGRGNHTWEGSRGGAKEVVHIRNRVKAGWLEPREGESDKRARGDGQEVGRGHSTREEL